MINKNNESNLAARAEQAGGHMKMVRVKWGQRRRGNDCRLAEQRVAASAARSNAVPGMAAAGSAGRTSESLTHTCAKLANTSTQVKAPPPILAPADTKKKTKAAKAGPQDS